ncbi:unnamed protein product, partial [Polarella glacialis]
LRALAESPRRGRDGRGEGRRPGGAELRRERALRALGAAGHRALAALARTGARRGSGQTGAGQQQCRTQRSPQGAGARQWLWQLQVLHSRPGRAGPAAQACGDRGAFARVPCRPAGLFVDAGGARLRQHGRPRLHP